MQLKKYDIENNITFHYLKDDKYKSNVISMFLTVPLLRESVTLNVLIPSILKRGTQKYQDLQAIEISLENLYGASFGTSVDKFGNNQVLKFYIETVKDSIVNDNIFEKSLDSFLGLIFEPYLENGTFKQEYVQQEKELLKIAIENKINDKMNYAFNRCIEEVCEEENYGLYSLGYINDLIDVNNAILYNQYMYILKNAKIDILISSDMDEKYVLKCVKDRLNYEILKFRNIIYQPKATYISSTNNEKNIVEELDVIQGKLVLGLTIKEIEKFDTYDILLLNTILGIESNSKLYRFVVEKEHLAYEAISAFIRNTNVLLVETGIDIVSYDKAITVIKKQLNDLEKGNITKEEFNGSKNVLMTLYKTTNDSAFRTISYYANQSIMNTNITIEEAINKINNIKLKNVINVAKAIKLNTIYFLKNRGAK